MGPRIQTDLLDVGGNADIALVESIAFVPEEICLIPSTVTVGTGHKQHVEECLKLAPDSKRMIESSCLEEFAVV